MNTLIQFCAILIGFLLVVHAQTGFPQESANIDEDNIEIVSGEQRTIYEYRQNGHLVAIKVVPKKGPPYYMVPAVDAGLPRDLENAHDLYPQWVIVEW